MVDVVRGDDTVRAPCAECGGTGTASRRAGGRNTAAPLPVYDFLGRAYAGDILLHLSRTRQRLVRSCKSPDQQWRVSSLLAQYARFRAIAYH